MGDRKMHKKSILYEKFFKAGKPPEIQYLLLPLRLRGYKVRGSDNYKGFLRSRQINTKSTTPPQAAVATILRELNLMVSQKVIKAVTPAKAGVQKCLLSLDSGFRRNDRKHHFLTFY